jgi:hypothetical protein
MKYAYLMLMILLLAVPVVSHQEKEPDNGILHNMIAIIREFFSGTDSKEEKINLTLDSMADYSDIWLVNESVKKYGLKHMTESLNNLSRKQGFNCHAPAHNLGAATYLLFGNRVFSDCGTECHSGCIHGAMEAFFAYKGTANLVNDLQILCSSGTNKFFSSQCMHGVGHGLMAWANYELHDALKTCDLLPQNSRFPCHNGAFMENIFGPNNETEHYTRYLNDDYHFPCNAVDEIYRNACYIVQTSRMVELSRHNFSKVEEECAKAPSRYRPTCFESMGRDVSVLYRNPQKSINACRNISNHSDSNRCISGALGDQFWDQSKSGEALSFCKILEGSDMEASCYWRIVARASEVIADIKIKQEFCGKLPAEYGANCMNFSPSIVYPLMQAARNPKSNSSSIKQEEMRMVYFNGSYHPKEIKIAPNQKIVWINNGTGPIWPASNMHPTHEIYSDFDPMQPVHPGKNWSFVFGKEGIWKYHDHLNPALTGTITVG